MLDRAFARQVRNAVGAGCRTPDSDQDDIEAILAYESYRAGSNRVTVIFQIITLDECRKAIDQKRAEAC